MPAPLVTSALGNTFVKVRWEEPFLSDGLNRKEIGVTPKGVYRGFVPAKVLGTSNIQFTVGPEGDSAAVFDTSGAVAHGTFTPTTGWNVLVYTSATILVNITAILGGGGGATGVYAVVLRSQYNTGNAPTTDSFIMIVDKADVQATDIRLAEIDTTACLIGNVVDNAVLRLGPNNTSMIPPFVTVGDGYESFGDFNGNRASFAGTDTTNAIQKAINGLDARNRLLTNFGGVAQGPSTKGGVIFVKRGKYGPPAVAAAILPLAGMKIVGEGYGSNAVGGNTVEITRAAAFPGIIMTGIGIEVSNLTMIGAGGLFPLIRMDGVIDGLVRDVSFRDNAAYAAIELKAGATGNLIEDVRAIVGILDVEMINGGTVLITQGNNNKIQGLPVDVRLQPIVANLVFDNHILTGRVTTPDHAGMPGLAVSGSKIVNTALNDDAFDGSGGAAVLNSGSPSFGAVSTYMRGYVNGLHILGDDTAGVSTGAVKAVVTAGDIEIDGLFYGLRKPVDITSTVVGPAVGFVFFYARRKTTAPNIGSMEIVAYGTAAGNLPVYNTRRNAWTRFGTGTTSAFGSVPSERFLGCLEIISLGPTHFRAQQMAGNWVLLDSAENFGVLSASTNRMSSGTETAFLSVIGPLSLSSIPPIPMSPGIPVADIGPIAGVALADSIPVLLDAELIQTDTNFADDRNAFAFIGNVDLLEQNFRATFGGYFNRRSVGGVNPRIRSSTVLTHAALAAGNAQVVVKVQQELAGAPNNNRIYQIRVFQRGYYVSR